MDSSESKLYNPRFFNSQQEGSRKSARKILPIVMQLISPRSVLDVGCGVGTWLSVFAELGISDYLGIDGDYVDRGALLIPADRFQPRDLKEPFDLGRKFDLACSLEVAEHLPPARSRGFVESLTRQAPAVLFSAAIPQQGGTGHLNERWQSFWIEQFRQFEFEAIDCIRRRVWLDADVAPWYAQNAFLFARRDFLQSSPALSAERNSAMPADVVHPGILINSLAHQDFKLRVELSQPTREQKILATNVPIWLEQNATDSLKRSRGELGLLFNSASPQELPALFGGPLGETYRQLLRSSLRHENFSDAERAFVKKNFPPAPIVWSDSRAAGRFIAASLYYFPQQLPMSCDFKAMPIWLRDDVVNFLTEPVRAADARQYSQFTGELLKSIEAFLETDSNAEVRQKFAEALSRMSHSPAMIGNAHLQKLLAPLADLLRSD